MNVLSRTLCSFWGSSIGKKTIVALTGIVLLLFLPGHLIGNLLVFLGPDAINEYGVFLHEAGHGALVWVARIVLLTCFVVHIVATVQLTRQNRASRTPYAFDATVQASRSSRLMIWSGLTILLFVIYHLLHFTVRVANDFDGPAYQTTLEGHPAQNVYKMIIDGFSWAPATFFYIIAITCLCSHLSHGVASVFQTLGFRSRKASTAIKIFGNLYALVIWIGFLSIPIAIFVFGYGR
ncbi:MAG: succinate dehydrogenase cytochrome b subunit [Verrucomicrobia bacterium]|nr:succinate dehydrogenase cytochrome b subunit [Verrucomicrobiota bacterium]MDA1006386.1 succinate dehydrogenase cytochrome b subunit [Verrucomicrobiota bacterium]